MAEPQVQKPDENDLSQAMISAVIRTFSQTDEAFQVIEGLARQNREPGEFVVVDSGSAEWVKEKLRKLASEGVPGRSGPIPLRLIEIPNSEYQSARALNQAVGAAAGELIAIVSQDAPPTNDAYLAHLAGAFVVETAAGSYARQILGDEYHPLGEKDLEKTYPPVSRVQHAPDCWFVNTCSMIRRDLFERHPFDENALISEDHEWGRWAQSQGFTLHYVAEAKVRHYHHFRDLGELWERHYEEGRGLARIHQERIGPLMALYGCCYEVASDILWLIARGKPWYIPSALVRRPVKHAALYRGQRKGDDR